MADNKRYWSFNEAWVFVLSFCARAVLSKSSFLSPEQQLRPGAFNCSLFYSSVYCCAGVSVPRAPTHGMAKQSLVSKMPCIGNLCLLFKYLKVFNASVIHFFIWIVCLSFCFPVYIGAYWGKYHLRSKTFGTFKIQYYFWQLTVCLCCIQYTRGSPPVANLIPTNFQQCY